MFAEFRSVPVFCVTKWRSVVSVPSFEAVSVSPMYVSELSVIVVTFDCCLVDNWWLKAVSVKRAYVLLSAVAWFVDSRVICGCISVFGWIQDTFGACNWVSIQPSPRSDYSPSPPMKLMTSQSLPPSSASSVIIMSHRIDLAGLGHRNHPLTFHCILT